MALADAVPAIPLREDVPVVEVVTAAAVPSDVPLPAFVETRPVEAEAVAVSADIVPVARPLAAPVPSDPPVASSGPQDVPAAGRAIVLAGWVLSLVLLGGLAWAGVSQRIAIMHAWPPSERVYAALGLMRAPGPSVAAPSNSH